MTKAEKQRAEWLETYARVALKYSDMIDREFALSSVESRLALREWCIADEFVKFMQTGTSEYLESKFYDMQCTIAEDTTPF